MSKNITIKIDGVSTNLTIDKLRTSKEGSGTVDWVPEDSVALESLTVDSNGTYNPSQGKSGFSDVSVSVPGTSVTGKINGVEYTVTVDANGYLVYTPVQA